MFEFIQYLDLLISSCVYLWPLFSLKISKESADQQGWFLEPFLWYSTKNKREDIGKLSLLLITVKSKMHQKSTSKCDMAITVYMV